MALAGRSNVGKSSLVNAVTGVRSLAKTAKRPGRTQTLNFYALDDSLALVDLPGYGYAQVPERVRARWGPMIETYLMGRDLLRGVILLIDARHGPTDDDMMLWEWLVTLPLARLVVASKWDKLKRSQQARRLKEMENAIKATVVPFSAETKEGKDQVLKFLHALKNQSRP